MAVDIGDPTLSTIDPQKAPLLLVLFLAVDDCADEVPKPLKCHLESWGKGSAKAGDKVAPGWASPLRHGHR